MSTLYLKGVRGNGRGNGAINGPVAVRGNGASAVSRSPLSSINSLAIQEPTAAEYASIRKYKKVKHNIVFHLKAIKWWLWVENNVIVFLEIISFFTELN